MVADYIKRQIQQGELLPGQAIKEVALAEHLGISRAPVREALESLVQEGLVTSEPQKGKRVRLMSPEEIRNSYSVGGDTGSHRRGRQSARLERCGSG